MYQKVLPVKKIALQSSTDFRKTDTRYTVIFFYLFDPEEFLQLTVKVLELMAYLYNVKTSLHSVQFIALHIEKYPSFVEDCIKLDFSGNMRKKRQTLAEPNQTDSRHTFKLNCAHILVVFFLFFHQLVFIQTFVKDNII